MELFAKVRGLKDGFKMDGGKKKAIHINGNIMRFGKEKVEFSMIFDDDTTTSELYESIGRKLVDHVVEGQHGMIMTSGQSGTGKSYMMNGSSNSPGLITECVKTLISLTNELNMKQNDDKYIINAQFGEVYRNKIVDLSNKKHNVLITDHEEQHFISVNAIKTQIRAWSDFEMPFHHALKCRSVTKTKLNRTSSRGHFFVLIEVMRISELKQRRSQLMLVDLAGSEGQEHSGTKSEAFTDATYNNMSLTQLKRVIQQIGEQQKHVSYSSTMLTKLIKYHLESVRNVAMIMTISDNIKYLHESKETARFAAICSRLVARDVKLNDTEGLHESMNTNCKRGAKWSQLKKEMTEDNGLRDLNAYVKQLEALLMYKDKIIQEQSAQIVDLKHELDYQRNQWQHMIEEITDRKASTVSPNTTIEESLPKMDNNVVEYLNKMNDNVLCCDGSIIMMVTNEQEWQTHAPFNQIRLEGSKPLSVTPNLVFKMRIDNAAKGRLLTFALRFEAVDNNQYHLKNSVWAPVKKTGVSGGIDQSMYFTNGTGWHYAREWESEGLSFANVRVIKDAAKTSRNTVGLICFMLKCLNYLKVPLSLSRMYQPVIYCIAKTDVGEFELINKWSFPLLRFVTVSKIRVNL